MPDPLGGDIMNPQSLNRYAYVLNNPATLTDPLGLCGEPDTWDPKTGTVHGHYYCPVWGDYLNWGTREDDEVRITKVGPGAFAGLLHELQVHPTPPGPGLKPQAPSPSKAATSYCQQHGQLSFNVPFTHIPVTISLSATAFVNFSTTNDVALTLPPSAGVSLDITAGAPSGPNIPVQVGVGKNASVGTFLTPHGPSGFSLSIPLSPVAGSPVTLSPNAGNVCGMVAGGR